jgi:homocysteine S-methyltransferase
VAKTQQNQSRLLVAGSVGPYGAYLANGSEYRGDYTVSAEEMKEFHRPRIQALGKTTRDLSRERSSLPRILTLDLVKANVDLLACETMPSYPEIQALASLLQEEFPDVSAWVSCTVRDSKCLSDGTLLSDVVQFLDQCPNVVAIGVNCIPRKIVSDVLEEISRFTSKPLVAYPNSGEAWDGSRKVWVGDKAQESDASADVKRWRERGARLIGGCCRTGPSDIKQIQATLSRSLEIAETREEPK